MKKIGKLLTLFLLTSSHAFATAYNAPQPQESLIGRLQGTTASAGETVVDIAHRYDIGFNALQAANPQVNLSRAFPAGSDLKIPTSHLLPNQPRRGIVINLPEMRMYYYPEGTHEVLTYPIGIGKIGKTIPIKNTWVVRKTENPTWTPPEDIRQFNLEQGIVLPQVMPAGPDNPLGPYAIYTGLPTYLIHSTIYPESIGRRASFGCIRMYQNDIQDFFPSITKGIPVVITNSPVKVGWQNRHLFIEAHDALEEHSDSFNTSLPGMVHLIETQTAEQPALIDWQLVSYLTHDRDGVPHEVGIKI